MTVASRLIQRRKDLGFHGTRDFLFASQLHLEAAEISEELFHQLESGERLPTWDEAFALSMPLGCRVEWLLSGKRPVAM